MLPTPGEYYLKKKYDCYFVTNLGTVLSGSSTFSNKIDFIEF